MADFRPRVGKEQGEPGTSSRAKGKEYSKNDRTMSKGHRHHTEWASLVKSNLRLFVHQNK